MDIEVMVAAREDKAVVRRLLELNSHDFSEIDGRDLGPHGDYGYPYLDHYWLDHEDRHPFLIRVNGNIAGCVLVRAGNPHELGEFFIVRKYRRSGVGTVAARAIFVRFPGDWLVHEIAGNDTATAFWRHAIPAGYKESRDESGVAQRFLSIAQP